MLNQLFRLQTDRSILENNHKNEHDESGDEIIVGSCNDAVLRKQMITLCAFRQYRHTLLSNLSQLFRKQTLLFVSQDCTSSFQIDANCSVTYRKGNRKLAITNGSTGMSHSLETIEWKLI